ncbi:Uncharacterised protein [Enterobacter cloacae]|nr:Uncharacterised protein [Enterobacter cloacae]
MEWPRVIESTAIAQPDAQHAKGNHQQPHADHNAEGPEDDERVRAVLFREILQRRDLFIQAVRQDQAAERGNFKPVFGALLFHIRYAKQQQRGGLAGRVFPVAFNRGDFGRLVLKRIQAVHIPNHGLNGRDQQRHPHGHGEHCANSGRIVTAQQMPCPGCAHKQGAAQEGGDGHMDQAVRE